jgi:hypothetical protein
MAPPVPSILVDANVHDRYPTALGVVQVESADEIRN